MDSHANVVLVVAPQSDIDAMRTVVQGIDVKNPTRPTAQVIALKVLKPADIIARVGPLYPNASLHAAAKASILVRATTADMSEITSLISSLDTTIATPAPTAQPVNAVAAKQASPKICCSGGSASFSASAREHLRLIDRA